MYNGPAEIVQAMGSVDGRVPMRLAWRRTAAMVVLGVVVLASPGKASVEAAPAAERSGGTTAPAELRVVVDRDYLPTLVGLIDGARRAVGLVHFTFNAERGAGSVVAEALRRALARGVRVTGILDGVADGVLARNRRAAADLAQAGATLDVRGDGEVVHAKAVVVDGDQVLAGSTNLTDPSMASNHEANVLVRSPAAAAEIWRTVRRLKRGRAARHEARRVPLEGEATTLLLDGAFIDSLEAAVDGARDEVLVVTYLLQVAPDAATESARRLFEALARAAARGVDVRLILERSTHAPHVNRIARRSAAALARVGVTEVRLDDPGVITHAKVVVADGRRAVVGSTNWYGPGVENARQIDLDTEDPSAVADLAAYVQGLWTAGEPLTAPGPAPVAAAGAAAP